MLQKKTLSRKIFEICNYLLMVVLCIIMLYPLYYVVVASLSDSNELMRRGGELLYKPVGFSWAAYKATLSNELILYGYKNTIFIVFVGTIISLILSSMLAYVLTQTELMLNKFFTVMTMFTMYFGGGLIPFYILVSNLGMLDSIWALIIPYAINMYNVIILRTGFASVPKSLSESALIDGASPLRILVQIIIPLSKASIAVIGLYYAVAQWNAWFPAAIFIKTDAKKWPLQMVLRQILVMNDINTMGDAGTSIDQMANVAESVKYASIVVATLPILAIYPFIQKYFVKGVMVGAVKG